jgi:hypothetical protein
MASPLRPPPPVCIPILRQNYAHHVQGFISNFDNPEFLGTPVVVTAGVCLPLIFLFAFIRIYARALVKKWTLQDCKLTDCDRLLWLLIGSRHVLF